jgi:hypothetical protein
MKKRIKNMAKKYYYTCPYSAAYMAHTFDMMLGCEYEDEYEEVHFEPDVCPYDLAHTPIGDKAYIHPDSLHILEPQAGDLVRSIEWEGRDFYKKCHADDVSDAREVIQRNGKAFIMPEEER